MHRPMRRSSLHVLLNGICCWDFVNYRRSLIRAMLQAGHRVTVVAAADGHEEALRACGATVVCRPFKRASLNPLHDLGLAFGYLAAFRRLSPDVVVSFGIKPVIYGGIAAALARIRHAAVVTGLGSAFVTDGWLRRLAGALYRLGLASAERVFFLNADDRQYFFQQALVEPAKTALLPGEGIDTQHFSLQEWPTGAPCFLFVGRLIGDKGVREFVAAAHAVRESLPQARFRLLGKIDADNPSGVPEHEVRAWAAAGVVSYLGAHEDVRPFIADSHVVVLPSYREGVPRALLEAAACGRPVLASDVAGCREVVVAGETGWLCAPRSVAALAAAMLAAAGRPPAELAAMGRKGRDHVERRFADAQVCAAYLGFLDGEAAAPDR